MRIMAIGANIFFIGYGATGRFMPVLALHLVLLPINLARLRMMLRQSEFEVDRSHDKATGTSATAGASSGLL